MRKRGRESGGVRVGEQNTGAKWSKYYRRMKGKEEKTKNTACSVQSVTDQMWIEATSLILAGFCVVADCSWVWCLGGHSDTTTQKVSTKFYFFFEI